MCARQLRLPHDLTPVDLDTVTAEEIDLAPFILCQDHASFLPNLRSMAKKKKKTPSIHKKKRDKKSLSHPHMHNHNHNHNHKDKRKLSNT